MNAKYAEICRVGTVEADFQQALLVHFFSTKLCETSIIHIQQRKVKHIFLIENSKIITLIYNLRKSDQCLSVHFILS